MTRSISRSLAQAGALATGLLLASPVAAQEGSALDLGPLQFLRPSVGIEAALPQPAQQPAPAQAEPPGVEPGGAVPLVPELPGAVPAAPGDVLQEPGPPDAGALDPAAPDAPAPFPPASDVTAPATLPNALPHPGQETSGAAAAKEPAARPTQPLRVGVLAGRNAASTLARLDSFAEGLGQALGRPVEILPMSSYGAMIDAQSSARIDAGFFSAAAFALAQLGCQCVDPLVAPRAADGTKEYFAVIVAPGEAEVRDVDALRGKTVATAAADSVGGRRMALAALLAEGIYPETHFATLRDAGSAEEAVRLMVNGEVDAAFAWSSLSGEIGAGYSRGTLADLVARGEIEMSEIGVVWRSPPITHGPLAVAAILSDEEKSKIEAHMLALDASNPEAYDLLNPFYAGGYVAVNPEDYSGVGVLAQEDLGAVERAVERSGPNTRPEGEALRP